MSVAVIALAKKTKTTHTYRTLSVVRISKYKIMMLAILHEVKHKVVVHRD